MSLGKLLRKYALPDNIYAEQEPKANQKEERCAEDYEERAAILEYEAGIAREQAELLARH